MTKEHPLILIADDDITSRKISEAILARQGYELIHTSNGDEALACLKEVDVDVVLLDVVMPGVSGYEVCRRIKGDRRLRLIPIILLTALDGKDDLLAGLEAGADEFLIKPVHPLELSARVRTMLRIKQQVDELGDNLRFRDELAAMIVHDMRNPLSAIMGYSEMLLADPAGLSKPAALERLRIVQSQAQKLHSFSNELLMVSKLENGKLLLHCEKAELGRMLEDARRAQAPMAQARGITIDVALAAGPAREMEVDPHLVQRVVENLLANALKFSPEGSRVTLSLEYPAAEGAWRARIRVCDEGCGISAESRERIFDKYEIVSMKKQGVMQVGLGLYFCRLVAEAHGGEIMVEPNSPRGSVFTVTL